MRGPAAAVLLALAVCAGCAHGFVAPARATAAAPVLRARQAAAQGCCALRRASLGLQMAAEATAPADGKFAKLLADCKDWGLCRFITINAAGAVLDHGRGVKNATT